MIRAIAALAKKVNDSRMAQDLMPKEMYRAMIRLYALHRVAKSPLSSRRMTEELRKHGCVLSNRSVAAILGGLAKKGYLICGQNNGASSDVIFIASDIGRRAVARSREKLRASAEIFGE